ncbi:MAG: hypothetical protein O6763_04120 [Gammaproteobacteria bacterium]|nr:hypothetical protein [Gammaproteobacteria bacterium]
MSEKPVFWLGGKPGLAGAPKTGIEQDQAFAAALRQTCESNGFKVRDYVAAQGAFGSWLVHLSKDGRKQRLVWNGKENQLLFEQALEPGGWTELCTSAVTEQDGDGFIAAAQSLLATDVDPNT